MKYILNDVIKTFFLLHNSWKALFRFIKKMALSLDFIVAEFLEESAFIPHLKIHQDCFG